MHGQIPYFCQELLDSLVIPLSLFHPGCFGSACPGTKRFFLAVLNSEYPSSNNFQAKVKVNPIAEGKEMLSKIIPVVPLQFLCDLQDKGDDGSTDFYIKIHEDQLLDYVNINIISCDHGIIIDITSLLVTIEIRNLDANIS